MVNINKMVTAAIGVVVIMALLPTVAQFTNDAQNASGVSSQQSAVIGLVFTLLVLAVAASVYKALT